MKKSFLLHFLLVIIVCLLNTACKESIEVTKKEFDSSAVSMSITIPSYKRYPDFSNYIETCINADFNAYKIQAERESSAGSSTKLSYRTVFEDKSNNKYLNAFLKKYIYAGEQIEDEYYITFVYNKKLKKIETLTELTGKNLESISKICFNYFKQNNPNTEKKDTEFVEDWIKTGTSPNPINYTAYTADKDSITIYFPAGTALPFFYGPQTVVIYK